MYEKNTFIKNTACPKCREVGEDRSGDNMANYSDGSSYCWKCQHFTLADNIIPRFLSRGSRNILTKNVIIPTILLPEDCSTDYPEKPLKWIEHYDLSRLDLLNNGVLWSELGIYINYRGTKIRATDLLIAPFWANGELLGWQGRYFGMDTRIPKYISRGKLNEVYHFISDGKVGHNINKASQLILTEDIISAIKVSKIGIYTLPLFGVNFKSRIKQLRLLNVKEAILWLDPDMHLTMIKESRVGCLEGVKTTCILSTKDPKEHSYEEIRKYLQHTRIGNVLHTT